MALGAAGTARSSSALRAARCSCRPWTASATRQTTASWRDRSERRREQRRDVQPWGVLYLRRAEGKGQRAEVGQKQEVRGRAELLSSDLLPASALCPLPSALTSSERAESSPPLRAHGVPP